MDLKQNSIWEMVVQKLVRYSLIIAAIALVAIGSNHFFPNVITVSNSVNGRELPIYCVETPEKKVALSFDAAWGNGW